MTKQQDKATARPWITNGIQVESEDMKAIAICTVQAEYLGRKGSALANAALIVKAVNAHDALVAALAPIAEIGEEQLAAMDVTLAHDTLRTMRAIAANALKLAGDA